MKQSIGKTERELSDVRTKVKEYRAKVGYKRKLVDSYRTKNEIKLGKERLGFVLLLR